MYGNCKRTHHGVHGEVVVLRLKVHSVLVAHANLSVALQKQLFIVTDPVEHLQREPMCYAESFTHSTHSSCCRDSSSLTLLKYEDRVRGQTNSAPFLTPHSSMSYCYCVKISFIKSSWHRVWVRTDNRTGSVKMSTILRQISKTIRDRVHRDEVWEQWCRSYFLIASVSALSHQHDN